MIKSGKCPKCEKVMPHISLETIDIHVGFKNEWKGVSYSCPLCRTVISVSIDPIALKADTVNEIKKPGR